MPSVRSRGKGRVMIVCRCVELVNALISPRYRVKEVFEMKDMLGCRVCRLSKTEINHDNGIY